MTSNGNEESGKTTNRPQFLSDRIGAVYEGEEIRIWNSLTVTQRHDVGPTDIESHHKVLAGDGSAGKEPEFITPEMAKQLSDLDVYPNAEVLDPASEEVKIL